MELVTSDLVVTPQGTPVHIDPGTGGGGNNKPPGGGTRPSPPEPTQ